MKKTVSAILMALLSCALILGWRFYRNQAPELADIYTLDPTGYPVTYKLQEFRLKPHDRQWTLKFFTVYDENGDVEHEEIYQLDEDGQSYYIADNGNRIDVSRMSQPGFRNVTGFLSDWDVSREAFDEVGRIISRDAACPIMSGSTELLRWYYRPDRPDGTGDSAVCTMVRTMRTEVPRDQDPWMFFGPEKEPRWESTSYEITTFDCGGNETRVWVEADCYLKTDADGYLQMIVEYISGAWYYVQRVDEYGRPTWLARYGRDGHLYGWSVWEYEDL